MTVSVSLRGWLRGGTSPGRFHNGEGEGETARRNAHDITAFKLG